MPVAKNNIQTIWWKPCPCASKEVTDHSTNYRIRYIGFTLYTNVNDRVELFQMAFLFLQTKRNKNRLKTIALTNKKQTHNAWEFNSSWIRNAKRFHHV